MIVLGVVERGKGPTHPRLKVQCEGCGAIYVVRDSKKKVEARRCASCARFEFLARGFKKESRIHRRRER